jgi:hypothetical protein
MPMLLHQKVRRTAEAIGVAVLLIVMLIAWIRV